MRGKKLIGKQFTVSQKDCWLGHMHGSCVDNKVDAASIDNLMIIIHGFMRFYAPFEPDPKY